MNRSSVARAVAARDRGRSVVRSLTAVVGVSGIVAAGAVAFVLPGSARHTADVVPDRAFRACPSSHGKPGREVQRRHLRQLWLLGQLQQFGQF